MISIAIDGPAGAGKSSVAKKIAYMLKYIYADTGALYRAIGLYMLKNKIDIKNEKMVEQELKNLNLELKFQNNTQIIFLNGRDVSQEIRSNPVSMAASKVSAFKSVREFLLNFQKKMATQNNVVMDGRDIGTVILPNANLKIFLTATAEERAKRRFLQQKSNNKIEYNQILEDINTRDKNDSNRAIAPLRPADDAVILDSTNLDFDQVVGKILSIIKNNKSI
jgi:cytidylate kinase